MFEVTYKLPDIITEADVRTVPEFYKDFVGYRKSGIYAFEDFFTGEVLYIGKAVDLKGRIHQHVADTYSAWREAQSKEVALYEEFKSREMILSICFLNAEEIVFAERLNIEKYRPVWNNNRY